MSFSEPPRFQRPPMDVPRQRSTRPVHQALPAAYTVVVLLCFPTKIGEFGRTRQNVIDGISIARAVRAPFT